MSKYECISRYLKDLEVAQEEDAHDLLYKEFMPACYGQGIVDSDYLDTLNRYGLSGKRITNIEGLDLDAVVAMLTLLLRKDRANHGFSEPLFNAWKNGYLQRMLRRIAELDGTWERPNVVTFYHEYEKDGYLSNWFGSSFEYGGRTFATSEHWMMWQKACVFGAWDTADKILQVPASGQGKAKWLGKNKVPTFDKDVWAAMDQQLMRVGLRQKFVQNERLFNDLLSTGSAVLGEAAGVKDKKWGLGFDKHSPKLADLANWYGESLLGRTLMDVRSDLRQLCAQTGELRWSVDELPASQVWRMNLLELSRVPSMRSFALMYAGIVVQSAPHTYGNDRDVLKKVRESIAEID